LHSEGLPMHGLGRAKGTRNEHAAHSEATPDRLHDSLLRELLCPL
jgi:hypothetical protein